MMFDASTSQLIRSAPLLIGVDPQTLPQELTQAYAELVALRLRGIYSADDSDQFESFRRLKQIADIYEGVVDSGSEGEPRRAAAFVAATAHQLLGRILLAGYAADGRLLESSSIHPSIASPLLFLVAEQNADAREAAQSLRGVRDENLLRSAIIESIFDLANERYDQILERASRLRRARLNLDGLWIDSAGDALFGLCWSGIVQLACDLLGQPFPELEFVRFESAQQAFDRVVSLSTQELPLSLPGAALISSFAGPRHLARLLRHLAGDLLSAGILKLPTPSGASERFWKTWLTHRAKTKPVLWRNHREAVNSGILNEGRSAVLVLPTGAGKTTLSELKVATALSRGKKVIFLVPTLALVDQLRDELEETFPRSLGDLQVSADGDLTALIAVPELQKIEVMTPERCLALLSHVSDAASEVGLVVFDECHLLSPKGGGKRSLDAMLCLLQVLNRAPDADLLLLSAMLSNAEEFADWITESTGRACTAYQNPWKPSRQARGVVVYRREDLKRIARTRDMLPYALFGLQQNWNAQRASDIKLVALSSKPVTLNLSANGYATPNANGVANALAIQAASAGFKTIVFVQQADYAPTNARKIAAGLPQPQSFTPIEEALWTAVQAEMGGAEYALVQPNQAALPHNGDMIPQERRLVESLFKRSDGASVIVATPTLAQGMNLPAQFAILAGDKRQDETGRSSLEPHEILNAAGRAGRAGHLANGIVLMIPDPVAGFLASGKPELQAASKLRSLLPGSDQCVAMEDPLTLLLDLIQQGDLSSPRVRYFSSRVRAGEPPETASEKAVSIVKRSFAAFKARRMKEEAAFEIKVAALEAVLAQNISNPEIAAIAASTGLPDGPLLSVQTRISANLPGLPVTVAGWIDWIIDYFISDTAGYIALIGDDSDIVNFVVRGKKAGGYPTAQEFQRLKAGLRAWITGCTFREIEIVLGTPATKLKSCSRARDMVLKLANRGFYLIAASIAEVARLQFANQNITPQQVSVLETLPVAIRKGLDTPTKIAFAYRRPTLRSRVFIHREFAANPAIHFDTSGLDYASVLVLTTARMALTGLV